MSRFLNLLMTMFCRTYLGSFSPLGPFPVYSSLILWMSFRSDSFFGYLLITLRISSRCSTFWKMKASAWSNTRYSIEERKSKSILFYFKAFSSSSYPVRVLRPRGEATKISDL